MSSLVARLLRIGAVLAIGLGAAGCVVNPVTGKSELVIVSAAQELQIGAQNYQPMQQSQGGVFSLDPSVNRYVATVGQRIAQHSPRDLPYEFVVLNNSVPNAWALPGGKIAVNRGLLMEMQSEAELASVLGHEIVHAAAKHSARQMTRGMLLQALVIGTAVVTSDNDYGQLAVGAANIGAQLLSAGYSREAERESDYYGIDYMVKAGYNPQGAVDLQRTFLRLSQERGAPSGPSLFSTHPPSQERLELNAAKANELGNTGETGEAQFAAAMRTLKAAEPAYEAYDQGRKALASGDFNTATRLARDAVNREPREASFYSLLGDIALTQKNFDSAIRNYTDALNRDATFFYPYLQRGLAREQRGDIDSAVTDLSASLQLFETAPAYYTLGRISRQRGNDAQAKEYFARASTSPGNSGQAALTELVRMDVGTNPEQYVQLRSGTGGDGELLISVNNPNPIGLRNLAFRIIYMDSNGKPRTIERRMNGILAAGQSTTLNTGLGPFASADQFSVKLIGAAPAE
ncbi:MAG: M48 family metalloprotease [Pseudomonadota bacterium]